VNAADCPHRERCPGCPLLDRAYAEQLAYKSAALERALAAYPLLASARVAEAVPAEPVVAFRLRSKLVVAGAALGLFARGTHEVVDTPGCLVLRPRVAAVARAVRAALPLAGPLSSLDLREADAGVLVTAAVPPGLDADVRRALAERIAALDPDIASVALSTRDEDAPQLLGGELEVLVGPAELRHRPDPTAPWHYAAHGAFVQAHAGQLVRLHETIQAELGLANPRALAARPLTGLRVLELYAGSGALSLRLAARGAGTTLVESFAPAVRLAERAAREQAIALEALAADAADALATFAKRRERFDAVIVDPPRRGLAPEVRRRIAELEPAQLLYVSCDPETLARDAAHLALLGYGLDVATPFDMIPQTDAVETLARFVRRPAPAPSVLAEDAAFVAVDEPAHGALAGELSGVRVFAREPGAASAVERLLAVATAEYLVLVRGVMHPRGTLPLKLPNGARCRYERRAVLAGHSLVLARALYGDATALARAFARLGHPVLGDSRHGDRRSNAHFSHRHALERSFLHRSALELELATGPRRVSAPLAPDLELVLARLRAAKDHAAPRTRSRRRERRG
jgi:23S rRNA (uracil1939-C5)-methyltransferase